MKINGNMVLITGSGTRIGRALAQAVHREGSDVVIAGRTDSAPCGIRTANPGMRHARLDVTDPNDIEHFPSNSPTTFPTSRCTSTTSASWKRRI